MVSQKNNINSNSPKFKSVICYKFEYFNENQYKNVLICLCFCFFRGKKVVFDFEIQKRNH